MIPRIIIQTSRNKPEQYIIDMIKSSSPNWMYFHFNDEEIIKFFLSNPLIEFPNMVEKFYSKNVIYKNYVQLITNLIK